MIGPYEILIGPVNLDYSVGYLPPHKSQKIRRPLDFVTRIPDISKEALVL